MKQTREFANLLDTKVNLDDTRLGLLDQRVESVFKLLKADEGIGSYVKDKIPQGSWAHKTIIKPAEGSEYDADFLLRMEEVADWHDTPVEYLKYLRAVLAADPTYGKMPLRRKHRCVRLTYSGLCHLDIVPFITRADGTCWIINGDAGEAGEWERTDPQGFSTWFRGKDADSARKLRKVVRLLKFLRDRESAFGGCRSVILTTLVGEQVKAWKTAIWPEYYVDVPTALVHLVGDLDDYLQSQQTRPSVSDPSGAGGTFDHRWDDETFFALRDDVHEFRQKMDAAYAEADPVESRRMWQGIFGEGFDAPKQSTAGRFGVVPPAPGRSGRAG